VKELLKLIFELKGTSEGKNIRNGEEGGTQPTMHTICNIANARKFKTLTMFNARRLQQIRVKRGTRMQQQN